MKVSVVDLFCGAGGLSYGLRKAGLGVSAGLDFDDGCRFAYEENCKANFIHADIEKTSSEYISGLYDKDVVRVLAGCAPCQPFSTYSQSRKTKDERWKLLNEFSRIAIQIKPEVITMENVSKLAKLEIWTQFVDVLKENGYSVSWKVLDCQDYGIPQTRRRLVLLASRFGDIELPKQLKKQDRISVKDVIANLPKIDAGEIHNSDELHRASSLTEINLKRIKASKQGGTWRDWPEELVADCHQKKSGKSYPSVYGRMSWDKPSPTITTQFYGFGNGRFGHPEQNRAISPREAALIQSFPEDYKFLPNGFKQSMGLLGRMIGNAVPPKLGEEIGKKIIEHIDVHAA